MAKILIVEDEQAIALLIKYNLEKAGYETICVSQGDKVLPEVEKILVYLQFSSEISYYPPTHTKKIIAWHSLFSSYFSLILSEIPLDKLPQKQYHNANFRLLIFYAYVYIRFNCRTLAESSCCA